MIGLQKHTLRGTSTKIVAAAIGLIILCSIFYVYGGFKTISSFSWEPKTVNDKLSSVKPDSSQAGLSFKKSGRVACKLRVSTYKFCLSSPKFYECLPEKMNCCDQLKKECASCEKEAKLEFNFPENIPENFECFDLLFKCFSCKTNQSKEQYYRNISRIPGRINEKRGNIMLGTYVKNKTGYTEFTASVNEKYHNISSQDIHLFINDSATTDENTLRLWYGSNANFYYVKAEILPNILDVFTKSDYEILFLINSETVFLRGWREIISKHLIKSELSFLSLYHSSHMHNYTEDCQKYHEDLCEGFIAGKLAIAIKKELAKTILRNYTRYLGNADWNSILREEKLRPVYTRKSVVMQIGQSNQQSDNCGENDVPYRFNICEFPKWIKSGIEFYFDRCTSGDEAFSPNISIPLIEKQQRLWVRPAISYCLYGSKTRYTEGALENVARVFSIYPGWKIWIYMDGSVPKHVTDRLCEYNVHFVDMSQTRIKNKMSWRFLIASAPVKMYAIRDIDSRLLERGKAAVDEWIKSGRTFHVLRDHPNHSRYPMSGGMWGGFGRSVPNMREMIESNGGADVYMVDMNFLNGKLWGIVKNSVWTHDSHSIHKFGEDHPFPTEQLGGDFVGVVNFS